RIRQEPGLCGRRNAPALAAHSTRRPEPPSPAAHVLGVTRLPMQHPRHVFLRLLTPIMRPTPIARLADALPARGLRSVSGLAPNLVAAVAVPGDKHQVVQAEMTNVCPSRRGCVKGTLPGIRRSQ